MKFSNLEINTDLLQPTELSIDLVKPDVLNLFADSNTVHCLVSCKEIGIRGALKTVLEIETHNMRFIIDRDTVTISRVEMIP